MQISFSIYLIIFFNFKIYVYEYLEISRIINYLFNLIDLRAKNLYIDYSIDLNIYIILYLFLTIIRCVLLCLKFIIPFRQLNNYD